MDLSEQRRTVGRWSAELTSRRTVMERAKPLESFGWTGPRASGSRLPASTAASSPGRSGRASSGATTKRVGRAVRKLVAQGVAIEEKPPGIGRICRLHGRRILQGARLGGPPPPEDHVAGGDDAASARDRAGLLPQRVYRGVLGGLRRFFPLGLPIALDTERAVFVYAEPGYETATAIRSWGAKHGGLWKGLWDLGLKAARTNMCGWPIWRPWVRSWQSLPPRRGTTRRSGITTTGYRLLVLREGAGSRLA